MIKRLRQRLAARKSWQASVPDDVLVYAVGDIHGMPDELDRLLVQIADDVAAHAGTSLLIFLGDYVDRGPGSRDVVERLSGGNLPCDRQIFLKGNHEDIMLDVMDGKEDRVAGWLAFGGIQTLESYGIDRAAQRQSIGQMSERLGAAIPARHQQFLRALQIDARCGDYLFVHAGVRPGIPLGQQNDHDRLWIRGTFLQSGADHGAVVVHGHSINDKPVIHSNRIGIDTGCFASGRLTAVRLHGRSVRFMST